MIGIVGMIVGAAVVIYGFYLIFTSVDAVWGDTCPHCGYSYRGLRRSTMRCPECGGAIDRETRGYIDRKPEQLVCGLFMLIVGSGAFSVAMFFG